MNEQNPNEEQKNDDFLKKAKEFAEKAESLLTRRWKK
jgi:hypothetical protein